MKKSELIFYRRSHLIRKERRYLTTDVIEKISVNKGDLGGFDSLLIVFLNPDGDCIMFITHNTRFHQ